MNYNIKYLKYYLKYQLLKGGSFHDIMRNIINDDSLSIRDLVKLKQTTPSLEIDIIQIIQTRIQKLENTLKYWQSRFDKLLSGLKSQSTKRSRLEEGSTSNYKNNIISGLNDIEQESRDWSESGGQQGEHYFLQNSEAERFLGLVTGTETNSILETIRDFKNDFSTIGIEDQVWNYENIKDKIDNITRHDPHREIEGLELFLKHPDEFVIDKLEEESRINSESHY